MRPARSRPLRIIMSDHWRQATATLDTPTASPYAVSYFTLPKHYELATEIQHRRPGANVLPFGTFELNGAIPQSGVPVSTLPGWSARYGTIDKVDVAAGIVPAAKYVEVPTPRKSPDTAQGTLKMFQPHRTITAPDEGYTPPMPTLGRSLLRLEVRPRIEYDRNGNPPRSPAKHRWRRPSWRSIARRFSSRPERWFA